MLGWRQIILIKQPLLISSDLLQEIQAGIDNACDTDITKDTVDARYSAADMNQTPYQQQFTISEVQPPQIGTVVTVQHADTPLPSQPH